MSAALSAPSPISSPQQAVRSTSKSNRLVDGYSSKISLVFIFFSGLKLRVYHIHTSGQT